MYFFWDCQIPEPCIVCKMCVLILLGLGRMGHSIRLLSWHWNPPLVTSQPDAAPQIMGLSALIFVSFLDIYHCSLTLNELET